MTQTSETKMESPSPDTMKSVIVVATLLLWFGLVGFGLLTVLFNWPPEQRFLSLTEKVLLPLLKFTIVAALSYVFGKPVVNAFVKRLSAAAQTDPGVKGGVLSSIRRGIL